MIIKKKLREVDNVVYNVDTDKWLIQSVRLGQHTVRWCLQLQSTLTQVVTSLKCK